MLSAGIVCSFLHSQPLIWNQSSYIADSLQVHLWCYGNVSWFQSYICCSIRATCISPTASMIRRTANLGHTAGRGVSSCKDWCLGEWLYLAGLLLSPSAASTGLFAESPNILSPNWAKASFLASESYVMLFRIGIDHHCPQAFLLVCWSFCDLEKRESGRPSAWIFAEQCFICEQILYNGATCLDAKFSRPHLCVTGGPNAHLCLWDLRKCGTPLSQATDYSYGDTSEVAIYNLSKQIMPCLCCNDHIFSIGNYDLDKTCTAPPLKVLNLLWWCNFDSRPVSFHPFRQGVFDIQNSSSSIPMPAGHVSSAAQRARRFNFCDCVDK